MKYIVYDQTKTDLFTSEFNSLEDAMKEAEKQFSRLTKSDLNNRDCFMVLESTNPDEDAPDHYDGNPVKVFYEAK